MKVKQLIDEMERIEDARYTWPDRWEMLRAFIIAHYKFPKTYCSQCGQEFGPGDSGYSHCQDHRNKKWGDTKCQE